MQEVKSIKDIGLGGELCEYCPLDKKGVYSTPSGISAGCEGSHCDRAYDIYLEHLIELEESGSENGE